MYVRITFICSVLNYFLAVQFYVGISKKCLCSNTTEERVFEILPSQESVRKRTFLRNYCPQYLPRIVKEGLLSQEVRKPRTNFIKKKKKLKIVLLTFYEYKALTWNRETSSQRQQKYKFQMIEIILSWSQKRTCHWLQKRMTNHNGFLNTNRKTICLAMMLEKMAADRGCG